MRRWESNAMVSKGVVPKYGDLITATYAVLKALGGSGKNEEINEKREKREMHTEGAGTWRENRKSRKMRYTHFRT